MSFDIWTTPNTYAVLGIVVYFVDAQFKLQTKILAIVRLQGTHIGEAQATELLKVINDFEFERDLGFFQYDNASSNDTYITAILARIQILH